MVKEIACGERALTPELRVVAYVNGDGAVDGFDAIAIAVML